MIYLLFILRVRTFTVSPFKIWYIFFSIEHKSNAQSKRAINVKLFYKMKHAKYGCGILQHFVILFFLILKNTERCTRLIDEWKDATFAIFIFSFKN